MRHWVKSGAWNTLSDELALTTTFPSLVLYKSSFFSLSYVVAKFWNCSQLLWGLTGVSYESSLSVLYKNKKNGKGLKLNNA